MLKLARHFLLSSLDCPSFQGLCSCFFAPPSEEQLAEWVRAGLAIMQYTLWTVSGSSQQQRLQTKMGSARAERKWPTRMAAEKPDRETGIA